MCHVATAWRERLDRAGAAAPADRPRTEPAEKGTSPLGKEDVGRCDSAAGRRNTGARGTLAGSHCGQGQLGEHIIRPQGSCAACHHKQPSTALRAPSSSTRGPRRVAGDKDKSVGFGTEATHTAWLFACTQEASRRTLGESCGLPMRCSSRGLPQLPRGWRACNKSLRKLPVRCRRSPLSSRGVVVMHEFGFARRFGAMARR